MVSMYPQVYPPNMLPVILEEEVFVGRETEIEELTDWIGNSTIISIVGSPGFGKSTLACGSCDHSKGWRSCALY